MKVTVWWRAFNSRSDNRQAAPETKIANRISAGFVAIAFSFCATVADAQQPGKAARIGYLDGVGCRQCGTSGCLPKTDDSARLDRRGRISRLSTDMQRAKGQTGLPNSQLN